MGAEVGGTLSERGVRSVKEKWDMGSSEGDTKVVDYSQRV